MAYLYRAYNTALSTTTGIAAGTSFATGAKVALQLGIPSGGYIQLVEWGISLDVAQSTSALVEVAYTATASTMTTAHSTTTVQPDDVNAPASRLTMSTTATGYGSGAITSNTTLSMAAREYVSQGLKVTFPLEDYPKFGNSGAARLLQFRINTAATVNGIIYAAWREII
jgi:hypothetical protein